MKKRKGILVVLLAMLIMVLFVSCDSSDYKKAVELFDSREYETAFTMFQELGDYEESASYVELCKIKIGSSYFETGDFKNAEEYLKSAREGIDDELWEVYIDKHLTAMNYLKKVEGKWTVKNFYHDDRDMSYYGDEWTDVYEMTYEIKPPYKITQSIYSDCDWRVEATVDIDAELWVLTGGSGGTMSTKKFSYYGEGGFDHIEGDPIEEMSDGFAVKNSEGKCLFTPRRGTNSYFILTPKSDGKAEFMEIPYSYDFSSAYYAYTETITLAHEKE